ncbi:MAG: O-antigen ligase family protein, partial [Porticoccus sp.]
FWNVSSFASFFVVLGLCFSQFIQLGSLTPRWGSVLFGMPVYGFPNSVASYYVLFVMFSVVACIRGQGTLKYGITALIVMMFMLMSLSRAAVAVLLIFLMMQSFFWFSARGLIKLVSLLFVLILVVFVVIASRDVLLVNQDVSVITGALENRWDRTFSSGDPTSGRVGIALETLSLVSEKPVFGYKFDSFSNYHSGHETPHNQYLEALFKTGLLGASVYFFTLFVFVWVLLSRTLVSGVTRVERRSAICFVFALAALIVGNLAQPNFTYSQTGNVVFFVLGFFSLAEFGLAPITTDRIDGHEVGITKHE